MFLESCLRWGMFNDWELQWDRKWNGLDSLRGWRLWFGRGGCIFNDEGKWCVEGVREKSCFNCMGSQYTMDEWAFVPAHLHSFGQISRCCCDFDDYGWLSTRKEQDLTLPYYSGNHHLTPHHLAPPQRTRGRRDKNCHATILPTD